MFKLGQLVVEGPVTDTQTRQGNNDRGPWRIVTAFVPGKRAVHEVNLGDDWGGKVVAGDHITAEVTPRVYQGNVTYQLSEMLELIGQDGTVKWSESDAAGSGK